MRVLFLQQQPCPRARKYGAALGAMRPDIELGFAYRGRTLSESIGNGDELFGSWWKLGERPARDLREALAEFRPDIVHSLNPPDSLTVLANDLTGPRMPVIHDIRGLHSLHRTPYDDGFPQAGDPLELERRAIEESAALVAASRELLHEAGARYALPSLTCVFPNYALERDLPQELPAPEDRNGEPGRVVYQGTLSTDGGHYDLRETFKAIVDQGLTLDIYPAHESPAYKALAQSTPGFRCHDPVSPDVLLQVLPHYDLGWAGFNDGVNGAHLETLLPNKLYEYAACGVPAVTLRHRALSRLVGEQGLGICLDDVSELSGRLAEIDVAALRRNLAERRWQLTFECNIGRIVSIYETLAREPIVGIAAGS